jgi:type 1 glutamine amidotransferase
MIWRVQEESMRRLTISLLASIPWLTLCLAGDWVVYEGGLGPGEGKHIVLVSGDEEYRSEEALPMLGKILSQHHGFKCTVLFAITEGVIDPNNNHNIPGLQFLEDADLMVIATRWRDLPDSQMKHIDAYLRRGGPVIGLRTATHAFKTSPDGAFAHYSDGYNGEKKDWTDGFGRLVLGEKWISHHGSHGKQATRGVIVPGAEKHPIVRGCEDIFAPSDVYTVRLPLPGDSKVLINGMVLQGMTPDDAPLAGEKNSPPMPVAWIKTYSLGDGTPGRVFTTTMGAAVDFESEGLRRLVVNAAYWATGLEDQIPMRAKVDFVGGFKPSLYGFKPDIYWEEKNLQLGDFELKPIQ